MVSSERKLGTVESLLIVIRIEFGYHEGNSNGPLISLWETLTYSVRVLLWLSLES